MSLKSEFLCLSSYVEGRLLAYILERFRNDYESDTFSLRKRISVLAPFGKIKSRDIEGHSQIMAFFLDGSKASDMLPLAENKSGKEINNMLGKADFYPKIEESLKNRGFVYFDGKAIKGKTRSHHKKPDYIAARKSETVIGEIKSPQEPPTSSSWRQRQPNDTEEFAKVRQVVLTRERQGLLDPHIGGHDIIIRGQILITQGCSVVRRQTALSKKGVPDPGITKVYDINDDMTTRKKFCLSEKHPLSPLFPR